MRIPMPRYSWKGIDLAGKQQRGTLTADSPVHLKECLLNNTVALLSYTEQATSLSWIVNQHPSTRQTSLITFFEYLHHLLDSGVPLLTSLELVTTQLTDQYLSTILKRIIQQIKKGEAFSTALKAYPEIFSPIIIQLITSGEKTGKLTQTLTYLCTHLKEQNTFKKTLIQAALFPLFTMAFALIIMIGILVFIIPQFEIFFRSMGKTLPPLTQGILTISTWFRSWYSLIFFAAFLSGIFFIKVFTPKKLLSSILAHTPLLGTITTTTNLIITLRMLSLFLKAGIPLKESLETLASSVKNQRFSKKIQTITYAIIAGQSLANQLPKLALSKDVDILSTFVTLGEQTGKLDIMLDKATNIFEEKLKKHLALFTLLFQPTLMIIVGLAIAFLMAAVYLPLFNLAYSIS